VDVPALPLDVACAYLPQFRPPETPTADDSLVATALQQQQRQRPAQRGTGSRKADGEWSVSWCKERYWGEVPATCSGVSVVVKVILPPNSFFTNDSVEIGSFYFLFPITCTGRLHGCLLCRAQSPFFPFSTCRLWVHLRRRNSTTCNNFGFVGTIMRTLIPSRCSWWP
jgi:hypothetical protein